MKWLFYAVMLLLITGCAKPYRIPITEDPKFDPDGVFCVEYNEHINCDPPWEANELEGFRQCYKISVQHQFQGEIEKLEYGPSCTTFYDGREMCDRYCYIEGYNTTKNWEA